MKTKYMVGDTSFNDGLSLPEGMLSVDGEKKALRFHLEGVPGGYEMLGQRAVEVNTGPGPQTLISGDMTAGFFGEVTATEFISYENLSSEVGISAGTLYNNAESAWLKTIHDGRVLFIAKKPIRGGISWNQIDVAGAVFGSTTITIKGSIYKVRLLRISDTNPESGPGGEFTGIFLKLLEGELASYVYTDIGGGEPRWPWGQEQHRSVNYNRVRYGGRSSLGFGATTGSDSTVDSDNSYNSWRPVLELVV